jgi:hypothetical protein
MNWLSSIAEFLGGIGSWMRAYMSPANTIARVKNDQTEKIDEFHNDVKTNNLDAQRHKLS